MAATHRYVRVWILHVPVVCVVVRVQGVEERIEAARAAGAASAHAEMHQKIKEAFKEGAEFSRDMAASLRN